MEYAHIGGHYLKDGSAMFHHLVPDDSGRNLELKLTWLSHEVGAVPVPPIVYRHPKNVPQIHPSDIESLTREVILRYDAGFREVREKHGIPYIYGPFQPPPTTITIDDDIVFGP